LSGSLILPYQGLEGENHDQKSPGLPGWVLMQQTSPLLIDKKEIAKNPIGNTLDR
jgi:hypothetical protein